jgi:hypothetical protein
MIRGVAAKALTAAASLAFLGVLAAIMVRDSLKEND